MEYLPIPKWNRYYLWEGVWGPELRLSLLLTSPVTSPNNLIHLMLEVGVCCYFQSSPFFTLNLLPQAKTPDTGSHAGSFISAGYGSDRSRGRKRERERDVSSHGDRRGSKMKRNGKWVAHEGACTWTMPYLWLVADAQGLEGLVHGAVCRPWGIEG